jgi:GNAT superfamily N-acetyltransferase
MPSQRDAVTIRLYDPDRDVDGIRRCFIELQDHEHEYAPQSPTGQALVDEYVPFMLERAMRAGSAVFIAEVGGQIVGFATALRTPRAEPDDTDPFHFELAELSVVGEHRSRGIGTALVDRAAQYARDHGAPNLRVRVDVQNPEAIRLYQRAGFEPAVIMLVMPLVPGGEW